MFPNLFVCLFVCLFVAMENIKSLLEVCEMFPIVSKTAERIDRLSTLPVTPSSVPDSRATIVHIPVTLLRWTHDDIEEHAARTAEPLIAWRLDCKGGSVFRFLDPSLLSLSCLSVSLSVCLSVCLSVRLSGSVCSALFR